MGNPKPQTVRKEFTMKRLLVLCGIFVMAGIALSAPAQNRRPPSEEEIAFAKEAADLMTATLFAALLQEFAETTPANVQQGIQSIGLIFNDRNSNMRLVGALQPLSDNDLPDDTFEETALAKAMTGVGTDNVVERDRGEWVFRRAIPLSNFHPACVMCHTNFGSTPSDTEWVGALMLKVPILDQP
jgi:hypothetical protein